MIFKSFELEKINLNQIKIILLHGKNEGLKKFTISKLSNKNNYFYDEKEILENEINFFESTLNKSLFETEKTIIINRPTSKIINIIEQIEIKKLDNILIIINAENLEKKSKLRSAFEKSKHFGCIAFYPDNDQTLSKLAHDFIKKNKISLSQSNLNFIISKCGGERQNLISELNKIRNFVKNGKGINFEILSKLINLSEEHSVLDLVDNCLAKNTNRVIKILNENNFSNEDSILIIRSFLSKAKKLNTLSIEYEKNKDIHLTISSAKPPIFWKDKEITKLQIKKNSSKEVKELIYKLSNLELLIKKHSNFKNLIMDFILKEAV